MTNATKTYTVTEILSVRRNAATYAVYLSRPIADGETIPATEQEVTSSGRYSLSQPTADGFDSVEIHVSWADGRPHAWAAQRLLCTFTEADIRALRVEAGSAGDRQMVEDCETVLYADFPSEALSRVGDAIAEARAAAA